MRRWASHGERGRGGDIQTPYRLRQADVHPCSTPQVKRANKNERLRSPTPQFEPVPLLLGLRLFVVARPALEDWTGRPLVRPMGLHNNPSRFVVCLPRRQVPSGDCNSTGPPPPPLLLLLLLLPSLSPIHSITTTQHLSPLRRAGWLSQHPAPSHRTALIVGAGDMQTRDMASCPLGCLQLVAASARYLFLPPRLNSSIRSASNCDAIRRVLPSSRQCSVGMYMMYH